MIVKKNSGIEVVQMGEELAMMNVNTGKYLVINEVGRDIWALIDGVNSTKDIVNNLVEQYEVSLDTCSNEVTLFIQQLIDEKIVSY